jgi:hypothetical protein
MATADNYYQIILVRDATIYAPKSSVDIADNHVSIKRGRILHDFYELDEKKIQTVEKIGEPPFLTMIVPLHRISVIREYIGNYEVASSA